MLDPPTDQRTSNELAPLCIERLTSTSSGYNVLLVAPGSSQQKVLGQDGQDLAHEAKILSRRPNLAQNLAQDLRQDPGQDFGRHYYSNLGILDKILPGQVLGKRGQVLGKSWARSLAQELFAGLHYSQLRILALLHGKHRKNFRIPSLGFCSLIPG